MKKLTILLTALILCVTVFAQTGEKRIALVIGNAAYTSGGALKNPVNDANLMATSLQDLGFTVIKRTNATRTQMAQAVAEYWDIYNKLNIKLLWNYQFLWIIVPKNGLTDF